jgi:spermidine synthase
MIHAQSSLRRIQLSIFLVSAAMLAYEIILIKILSIQYWYHFAYLIISIALLGFGTSGTFIFLLRKTLKNNVLRIFYLFPLLMVGSIWINVSLSRLIDFNPLMIIWQHVEIVNLAFLVLALFVPFFLGAVCIGMGFVVFPDKIHRIYFSNLVGSGLGTLLVALTVLHVSPYDIIFIISLIAIAATFPVAANRFRKAISLTVSIAAVTGYFFFLHDAPLVMTPFKDLSRAEHLQHATTEFQQYGPLGLVTVIDSPAYHYLPDLSLTCSHLLPKQKGLFMDGNAIGAINRYSGNVNDLRFMECRTSSLVYQFVTNPDVLIIGGGGGTEILNAHYYGSKRIFVVEMNKDIISLMRDRYGRFSGGIYNLENCRIVSADGRGYLQGTEETFDVIQLSALDTMESTASGVYSLNENYLFTTEALRSSLKRLNPGGVISISRWVRNPPRESIKILATVINALEAENKDASQSIIMIRSWQTATLLVRNGSFQPQEIGAVKEFCGNHGFDLCYYPGITAQETNIINRLAEKYFFIAANKLLSGDKEQFYRQYPFDIRPATDNKPFFSHFFKMSLLKRYVSPGGRSIIPYMDWGYILVWTSLFILVVFSMVFILLPIRILRGSPKDTFCVFVYFGSLGLAYIFLEISFLQQFIRYLYDPVFSATVVICSFLVYSGVGSLIGEKIWRPHSRYMLFLSLLFIVAIGIIYVGSDLLLHHALSGLSLSLRMLICSILIAPLAIPMGIPFPAGLSRLEQVHEDIVPWAWGINGFFSVIGASSAVLIAIGFGFKVVIICALSLYMTAGIVYLFIGSQRRRGGFLHS